MGPRSVRAPVGTLRLPYVVQDVDRHGNVRTYIRLPRRPKIRVNAPPGTAEFAEAYSAALASVPQIDRPAAGTFRALTAGYYASSIFKALDVSTQNWRRRALDSVCQGHGDKPVALLQPKHIRALRNELADKPVVANKRVKALKALFKWAVNAGEADRNPAREVDLLHELTRGHHSWTLEEVETFEKRFPIGTKARLAMALLLYTAGRREDAVRLGPQHIRGGRIRFTQAKNEHRKPVKVDIPLHPDLAAVIAGSKVGHLTFMVTEFGKPHTANGFGNWFADRCTEAGVPGRAHGLRKALATRLANSGATPHEIQAWTGHTTLEEVEVYTRDAAKARNADAGLVKLRVGTKTE